MCVHVCAVNQALSLSTPLSRPLSRPLSTSLDLSLDLSLCSSLYSIPPLCNTDLTWPSHPAEKTTDGVTTMPATSDWWATTCDSGAPERRLETRTTLFESGDWSGNARVRGGGCPHLLTTQTVAHETVCNPQAPTHRAQSRTTNPLSSPETIVAAEVAMQVTAASWATMATTTHEHVAYTRTCVKSGSARV